MTDKDKFYGSIIMTIIIGVLIILGIIVIGELVLTYKYGGDIDREIVVLLKMTISGLTGIVGGYIGGRQNTNNENNKENLIK